MDKNFYMMILKVDLEEREGKNRIIRFLDYCKLDILLPIE